MKKLKGIIIVVLVMSCAEENKQEKQEIYVVPLPKPVLPHKPPLIKNLLNFDLQRALYAKI